MDKTLLEFLRGQKVISVATTNSDGTSWIFNAFYSVTKKGELFFISDPKARHSNNIADNPKVSFSVYWIDEKDMWNRKAIQGEGECHIVSNPIAIGALVVNHFKFFPTWKKWMTKKDMVQKLLETRSYLITPTFMKFWNDELYGEDGTKEFKD
ncbi:hypothetical protein CO112_00280 [Candidatus Dojkabacteria bacterium CG_4_9_14_3_um_filter_150_Dojkabacteria_WS6_41_13]|uniref:Pyridoxamine 5'-phosphate oxidase N-terminal domain-containing protein n=1 Tax=Candidatus Dojkabacteria bacterium CG_4_10_14_0_2_um_filter_Dojkabacteria_WS6_41_15 TaxID=2014249 RepID=A0A2M7W298_9BACT|nr:MAG: hypothetical protein COX64_01990 [Candidatus Dojkabacteria bacterium CG_4_10_14_0_2_um_filter_Dojkabacteria_WS6_41_15]PJB23929.1 MAG: hypothetical protein CO112_00280 [Candidatus Dojkabacteria bacterium CG_4_9_14_3_um_filter_150_Dojkabacteria_WS6_41_13]